MYVNKASRKVYITICKACRKVIATVRKVCRKLYVTIREACKKAYVTIRKARRKMYVNKRKILCREVYVHTKHLEVYNNAQNMWESDARHVGKWIYSKHVGKSKKKMCKQIIWGSVCNYRQNM